MKVFTVSGAILLLSILFVLNFEGLNAGGKGNGPLEETGIQVLSVNTGKMFTDTMQVYASVLVDAVFNEGNVFSIEITDDDFETYTSLGADSINQFGSIMAVLPEQFEDNDSFKLRICSSSPRIEFRVYNIGDFTFLKMLDLELVEPRVPYPISTSPTAANILRLRESLTTDSGTGNVANRTLKLSLPDDTDKIDSIYFNSNRDFLQFRSLPGDSVQDPFPAYTNSAAVYDFEKERELDLGLVFSPETSLAGGYHEVLLTISTFTGDDISTVFLRINCLNFYNPVEWYKEGSRPGIFLDIISSKPDTSNVVFGSHPIATTSADTVFGEDANEHPHWPGYYEARLYPTPYDEVDNNRAIINGWNDVCPDIDNPYSNSRDIKRFVNDTTPLRFLCKMNPEAKDYPVKIEYNDYNFPPDAVLLMSDGPETDYTFRLDMRDVPEIAPGRHQYIISDTLMTEFWIIYYRSDKGVLQYTMDISSDEYCAGDSLEIVPRSYYLFNEDNEFIVELSSPDGSWDEEVKQIGAIKSQTALPVKAAIPDDVIQGSDYSLRIRTSSPEIISYNDSVRVRIFPDKLSIITDTSVYYNTQIELKVISPIDAKYYWYETATGDDYFIKIRDSYSMWVKKDDSVFVEAWSINSDCITERVKVMVRVIDTTGVEDIAGVGLISVYPNPANDYLFINFDEYAVKPLIKIYDILGNEQAIEYRQSDNIIEADVSNLHGGTYFLKYIYAGKAVVKKIYIE